MTTAREIMSRTATFVEPRQSVVEAASKMAKEDVGALPVCDDGKLIGMLTDRDLALNVVSKGRDPRQTMVADVVNRTEVVTIGADDSVEEAIRTMQDHAVRRLPVIDGKKLVGMVSQGDIARAMPDAKVGDLVGAISEAPSNSG